MKKLLKKVLALSLCACMMVGVANGASAAMATPRLSYQVGGFYY